MTDDVQDWRAVLDGRREWAVVLGDCLDVLRELPAGSVDAVVTDPPYGVSMKRGDSKIGEAIAGDLAPPDVRWVADYPAVVWGGNNFCDQLPRSTGWLVWHKTFPEMARFSQAELAWTNVGRTVRLHTEAYHGFMRQREGWFHPTQKPIGLMRWCLERAKVPADAVVFDPYAGSGTTGVACIQTGRRFIGVEIDPTYHAIAVERLTKAAAARQPALPLEGVG